MARAKALGRPLLVLVVPADASQQYERGDLLGVYLNRASDEQMADLALCEIWCAQPAEIRSRIASDSQVDDATLAVLVETDGRPCSHVTGEPPSAGQPFGEGWHDEAKRNDASRARNQFLYERLHAVIAPDRATLRRRSDAACAKVFPKGSSSNNPTDRRDVPSAKLAQRVPAWVRWCAEDADRVSRSAWIGLLSDEAVRRWRSSPPPRAQWAKSTGCGVQVEHATDDPVLVGCGMGYTPEYSSRFLMFFTEKG